MRIDIERSSSHIKWKSKIENNMIGYYLYKRSFKLIKCVPFIYVHIFIYCKYMV